MLKDMQALYAELSKDIVDFDNVNLLVSEINIGKYPSNNNPLMYFSMSEKEYPNSEKIIKELIKFYPINLTNDNGLTALMFACNSPFFTLDLIKLLYSDSIVNYQSKNGLTALMVACRAQHPQDSIINFLLDRSDKLKDKCLHSVGMHAIYNKSIESISLETVIKLINLSEINDKSLDGYTILMVALGNTYASLELIKYLLEKSDTTIRDNSGQTALMKMVCSKYYVDPIKFKLVLDHTNANLLDKFGQTALMIAMYSNTNYKLAKMLLPFTDLSIQNDEGDTALGIACKYTFFDKSLDTGTLNNNLHLLKLIIEMDYLLIDKNNCSFILLRNNKGLNCVECALQNERFSREALMVLHTHIQEILTK